MKYEVTTQILKKMDTYIFFVCSDMKSEFERITKMMKIEKIPKKMVEEFKGEKGEEKVFYMDDKEVIFIGYGKKKKCEIENLYSIFGHLGKRYYKTSKRIWIECIGDHDYEYEKEVSEFILGNYKFDKYLEKDEKEGKEGKIHFYTKKRRYIEKLKMGIEEALEQNRVRNLINEPGNKLNTTKFVDYMKKNLEDGIKMKVLHEKDLKKEGLNLILAVNQGSKNPAKMVILEYISDAKYKKEKSICLVGKGVMFDSGGYNLKTNDFSDMKEDMAGAAIVYGLMNLLSKMKIKGHFVGILPLVENMIDGGATRPGDIIKSYNGKTVEIIDTDAEGRLILADGIGYTEKYDPKLVIDIATLTGSAAYIFGNKATAMMGYKNPIIEKMKNIGERYKEHFWELPMWEEYVELTKSEVADYKNLTSSAHAGAIMGGAFLYNFVPKMKDIEWIHLDIAGVDYIKSESSTRYMGATAESFQTLFHFLIHE